MAYLVKIKPEIKLISFFFIILSIAFLSLENNLTTIIQAVIVLSLLKVSKLKFNTYLKRLSIDIPFILFALFLPFVSRASEVIGKRIHLKLDNKEYVLRRPPLGPIAPSSHDMLREYKVQSQINSKFPLAPKSLYFCDDESVIGSKFHIIERRNGYVIRKKMHAKTKK